MNTLIKTLPQLKDAELNTYIYGILIAVVLIIVLIIVANLIPWQAGAKDRSGETRRAAFWVILAIAILSPVILNYFLFLQNILVPHFKSEYMVHMGLAGLLSGAIYGVISFVIIRTQNKKTKLASIFPKKD